MSRIPCVPSSAPFTPEQRAWLNGYLAGLFADANVDEAGTGLRPESDTEQRTNSEPLLVMYGSQTGNAEQLAKRLAAEASQRGFAPRVLEMNAFTAVDLEQEQRLLIVTSTWGDGDPPDNAAAFWDHLNSDQPPKLDQVSFSVLALGDRNYSDFCGAGKKFDARLELLGAKRIHPRADCDTDYAAAATSWMEGLWPALGNKRDAHILSDVLLAAAPSSSRPGGAEVSFSAMGGCGPPSPAHAARALNCDRDHPFPGRLINNRTLNLPGSGKDTRHLEIALEGSGLAYEVGDAVGVWPENCPALVGDLLQALGCDGEEAVKDAEGHETSLRHALLRGYQITQPTIAFLQSVAEQAGDTVLGGLLDPARKTELDRYLYGREIVDFLLNFSLVKFAPAEFVRHLRKLQPRLYSISSSLKAHPSEVHLTVAVVRYESHRRTRKGVCSTYLAERVELNASLPVFVQTSRGFRLPDDNDTPVIMIGPGTGIAPFRAFLEERRAIGARGRNWLFFGDQQAAYDFLYRDELEKMVADGGLTRLDTAFSRDQGEKIYVQHRLRDHAREVWAWLEEGAHIYVCGDARRMARDVDTALHEVVQKAASKTAEQAAEFVRKLKTEKRYQRDVY